jgi:CheY-like chemotaxis protein
MPPQPVGVLVIDDDAMSREVLGVLLEMDGYAVQSAESGDAALCLLRQGQTTPELVLTDMQMPGTSGEQLAKALRAACGPEAVLLAMSGSGAAKASSRHFDGFLLKPFTMEELRAARLAGRHGGAVDLSAASDGDETGDADEKILNESIYAHLGNLMPRSQLHAMYAMCLEDVRGRVSKMRAAAAAGDGGLFMQEAHAIKGGCGMLGAKTMYRQASRLEMTGLAAMVTREVNPLDELVVECDRLESILGARDVT